MISLLLLASLLMIQTQTSATVNSDFLPCRDSSPACVQTLTMRALDASPEIKVLDEAIKLNKTKLWTNYLSANALNPLSLVLQVARNIVGGGDVAQAKLTTSQLRATRAALEKATRSTITQDLSDYETAARTEAATRSQLEAHEQRLSILLVSYRLGDSTTEAVLPEFVQSENLRAQIETNSAAAQNAMAKLRETVNPTRVERMNK